MTIEETIEEIIEAHGDVVANHDDVKNNKISMIIFASCELQAVLCYFVPADRGCKVQRL